jgi:hypothetical protein
LLFVLISPFSSLILCWGLLLLSFGLAKCQSCLSFQRSNFLFHWCFLLMLSFSHHLINYFYLDLYYFFPSTFESGFFPKSLKWIVRFFFLIWDLWLFNDSTHRYKLPLSMAFAMSKRFWHIVFIFSWF